MVASITNISNRAIVISGFIVEHGETLKAAERDEALGEEIVAARARFEAASADVISSMIDLVRLGGVSRSEAHDRVSRLSERLHLFIRVTK
jgi:hypothetical protein